jgi:hypothetical protein
VASCVSGELCQYRNVVVVNCYVASSDVASSVVASCVVANCVVASCYVANCMGIKSTGHFLAGKDRKREKSKLTRPALCRLG